MSLWWKIAAWLQLAWPFTIKLVILIADGRVTRDELIQLIDGLLKGKTEIVLWGGKKDGA
jgi:hypothetical protein